MFALSSAFFLLSNVKWHMPFHFDERNRKEPDADTFPECHQVIIEYCTWAATIHCFPRRKLSESISDHSLCLNAHLKVFREAIVLVCVNCLMVPFNSEGRSASYISSRFVFPITMRAQASEAKHAQASSSKLVCWLVSDGTYTYLSIVSPRALHPTIRLVDAFLWLYLAHPEHRVQTTSVFL